MTFKSRLKMLIGTIVVIVIVGSLTLYLNNMMSSISSAHSNIEANSISIGTDYPGLVIKQYVQQGDKVTKGQMLFEIQSQQLDNLLSSKQVSASSLPFSIDSKTNDIELTANQSGVIQQVLYPTGSYAPDGSVVATMDTTSSLYVEGHFNLDPPDYARIKNGDIMKVTFPDNSHENAVVYNISLVGDGDKVDTIIKAKLPEVQLTNFKFAVGTPVQSTLRLTSKTWYQGLTDFFRNLFKPKAS